MKVKQFNNKNQFVITSPEKIIFQSYNSTCAIIDDTGALTLGRDWDFSNTTRKHLYMFISEYMNNMNGVTALACWTALQRPNKRQAFQDLIDGGAVAYNSAL